MDGCVVQHENDHIVGITRHQEMLQKGNKGGAILAVGNRPGNCIIGPIVSAKDMSVLLLTRRGDALLLTSLHPARPQRRVQAHCGFVHKEEPVITCWRPFLNSSSCDCTAALASRSCRLLKSCLGRR